MGKRPVTLQDIIRQRQAGGFVGRRGELEAFERNLDLPVDDPRRRFLFTFHGDAGVGKTFLVRQLARLAGEHGYAAAYLDETDAVDVLGAMERLTAQWEAAGVHCRDWTKRLAAYRQRRRELDRDPGAPDGMASLLTRSATRIGVRLAADVPVVGAVAAEVDPDALGRNVDQLRMFLSRKFHDHRDVQLVLSPVEELTPAFVTELSEAAGDRPIALFFDTFERTSAFLEPWLLDLLGGRYGALPANLVITVAGQHPLDPNRWSAFLGLRDDTGLEVFTPAEARNLLAGRGITDERTTEVILEISGRLPLLVAMLAQSGPASAEEVGDPSGDAVERFLKWEPDERRRSVAMAGAFPRWLDADVLAAACAPEAAADDFDWLCRLPFVSRHADGFRYHQVVRAAMLRVSRAHSPQAWWDRHLALAAHHRAACDGLDLSGPKRWDDDRWRAAALEEHYHYLCARTPGALPRALEALVDAYAYRSSEALPWAQIIAQAGTDSDLPALRDRGDHLSTLAAGPDDNHITLLTDLATKPDLDAHHRGTALAERGELHRLAGRYDKALTDFTGSLELRPDYAWAIAERGWTYLLMGRYDDALTGYTRAIERNPTLAWAIAGRGLTYRRIGRYDDALTDFTLAIELNPPLDWAIAGRGWTYRLMGRYDDALTDYTRAIELSPTLDWATAGRGLTYRLIGRYDDALTDLTRAIELSPTLDWAIVGRGETYRLMGRYGEAVGDLDRAIELDPRYDLAYYRRGLVAFAVGRADDGRADMERAARHCAERADEDPTVEPWLAVCLLAAGRAGEAEQRAAHAVAAGVSRYDIDDALDDISDLRDVLGPVDGMAEVVAALEAQRGRDQ
ncbi:MAG TPA: tetratricopeptide repeat protein [Mycobacteriales bacterium]|nr:tetratricopeptide repeat protein [Mycobacteriales bacterium]